MLAAYRRAIESVRVRDAVPLFPCDAYTPAHGPVIRYWLTADSVLVDAVTWRCAAALERAASHDDRGPRPDPKVADAATIKAKADAQRKGRAKAKAR